MHDRYQSLDPRFRREDLPPQHEELPFVPPAQLDQFETWEVFHQAERGTQHIHVGIVHAPDAELALLFAKEQFARRGATTSLWVVRSAQVFATTEDDADSFAAHTGLDKSYREASAYRNRERIEDFKQEHAPVKSAAQMAVPTAKAQTGAPTDRPRTAPRIILTKARG